MNDKEGKMREEEKPDRANRRDTLENTDVCYHNSAAWTNKKTASLRKLFCQPGAYNDLTMYRQ